MTKRTNSIGFLTILAWGSLLIGCANSDNKTISSEAIDTIKVQPPPPPKSDTVFKITQESTTSFVSQAKQISVNKKANKPFNKLDYNKVIAYDYEGGKGEGIIDIITDG